MFRDPGGFVNSLPIRYIKPFSSTVSREKNATTQVLQICKRNEYFMLHVTQFGNLKRPGTALKTLFVRSTNTFILISTRKYYLIIYIFPPYEFCTLRSTVVHSFTIEETISSLQEWHEKWTTKWTQNDSHWFSANRSSIILKRITDCSLLNGLVTSKEWRHQTILKKNNSIIERSEILIWTIPNTFCKLEQWLKKYVINLRNLKTTWHVYTQFVLSYASQLRI